MFVRPSADDILHMRMLRPTDELNSYMVLTLFRSAAKALAFAEAFQGRFFLQGLINDVCCVEGVDEAVMHGTAENMAEERTSADASGETSGKASSAVTGSSGFPWSEVFPASDIGACLGPEADRGALEIAAGTSSPCPVCLDVLDAPSSALVTTLCNHTMHSACLAKWDLNNCPVCRHTHELTPEASTCMSCGHSQGLWMCVVCAYVGCGVYTKKHAQSHCEEAHHPFAVILEDSTFFTGEVIKAGAVWDYVSGRFVHRLLSSEDGKIVEVSGEVGSWATAEAGVEFDPDSRHGSGGAGGSGAVSDAQRPVSRSSRLQIKPPRTNCAGSGLGGGDDEEEDDRGIDTAIYVSELYSEIGDYRSRVEEMESRHEFVQSQLMEENGRLREENSAIEAEAAELKAELASAQQELGDRSKQLTKRTGLGGKEGKDLREKNAFLKNLNETLLRDKQTWNGELKRVAGLLADKEAECREKEEQLRDMCIHLEAQVKMADASGSPSGCRANASGAEGLGGDIVGVGPSLKKRLAMKTRRK